MDITREKVIEVLSKIIEPDLKKDLVSEKLIADLTIEQHKISLTVFVINPALHAKKRMQEAIRFNLQQAFGQNIEIISTVNGIKKDDEKRKRKILPDVKKIIAVSSGKGGVGKSTITVNLAAGLKKHGYKVGVVDADIYGPSIPTMLDVVGHRPSSIEINGERKMAPVSKDDLLIMSIGFFTEADNAIVWRGPMASKALTQMFTDTHWGELDYLLIDLPPGTGDIHLSLVQTIPLDGAIIVSTPQEVALADARKGVNMFKLSNINVPIIGLIENMSWFTPAELPENKYYIFGRDGAKNLANGLNENFLGQIPIVQSLREASDIGRPAVNQENTLISNAFEELVRNFVQIVGN